MTKLNIAPHLDRSRQTSRKGTWGSGGRRLSCQTVAGRVVPGHWKSSLDKRADPETLAPGLTELMRIAATT